MLFNSIHFLFFFPVVLILYYSIPAKYRWTLLLIASYYFYMSWNAEYMFLILFTTVISYWSAIRIEKAEKKSVRRFYMYFSVLGSLAVLILFKYYNFFTFNLNQLSAWLNSGIEIPYLDFLLPVGISFYTFQTLSYTLDVYKGEKEVERHFGIYALYVSFFPQLVAGPIERSTHFMPQLKKHHPFKLENFQKGMKWIIAGFFMKLVIADRLALYVDSVYNNVGAHGSATYALSSFLFAFQIYGDFAGYSSIAIGTAKLMGYDLMENFRRPYLATTLTDFWRRWHISLSTWFRDYVYIPLGGNRVSKGRRVSNLMITFLVSGFWHGASWNFIIWGGIHGLILVLESMYFRKIKVSFPGLRILKGLLIFVIVDFAWIFFRANTIEDSLTIVRGIFNWDQSSLFLNYETLFYGLIGLVILWLHDLIQEHKLSNRWFGSNKPILSGLYYSFLVFLILSIGVLNGGQFIYFQF